MAQVFNIIGQLFNGVLSIVDSIFDATGAWPYLLFAIILTFLVSSILVPLFTKSNTKEGK